MISKVEVQTKSIELAGWTIDPKSDLWISNGNQQPHTGAMKVRSQSICDDISLTITKLLDQVPPNRKIRLEAQLVVIISEDE